MYQLFPHKADIGVKGIGKTLEEAFAEAAKGMFSVMTLIEKVEVKKEIRVRVRGQTLEELFVAWLNVLLTEASLHNMLLIEFEVKLWEVKGEYFLEGIAKGEKIQQGKHELNTEVKGAFFSGFKTGVEKGMYFVQCILDV